MDIILYCFKHTPLLGQDAGFLLRISHWKRCNHGSSGVLSQRV